MKMGMSIAMVICPKGSRLRRGLIKGEERGWYLWRHATVLRGIFT